MDGIQPMDPQAEFAEYERLIENGALPYEARANAFTAYEGMQRLQTQLGQVFGVPPHLFATFFGPLYNQGSFLNQRRGFDNVRISNQNLAPFAALSWDPFRDGKTRFALTAGRHYNNIPFVIPLQELAPATATVVFSPKRINGQWVLTDLVNLRGGVNPTATVRTVDHELRTPYQDELTLSFERQIGPETSLGVTWVKRKFRDQFQDRDINHIAGDFGRCVRATTTEDPFLDSSEGPDGILDDCSGELVPGRDPNPNPRLPQTPLVQRPDGVADLYTMNPFWGPILEIGNVNRADYEGLVVQVTRRHYRGWEAQASYTWSMARGDGEDFAQVFGNDAAIRDDEVGFQSTDQRHVFKAVLTRVTPWGVRLGGTVVWQSGLPYSRIRQTLSYDTIPPVLGDFGGVEGRVRLQYPTGVRNDQRNVSYWDFNLKAAREFRPSRGVSLQTSLEVFNLLNEGTYIIYNAGPGLGAQVNGRNSAYRRFGRRYQLGLKVSF